MHFNLWPEIVLKSILLLYILTFTALAQEDNTEPPIATSQSQNNAEAENLFTQSVSNEEKTWLSAGGSKSLALYRNDTSGRAHGGVVIIPEAGRYPTARGIINSLRHTLAEHHWHTLALDLTPHITDDGIINEERIQKTIAAGIEYLNKQGVYNIAILGEGIGAAHALQYVATLPATDSSKDFQQIRALIMINAQNKIPNSDTNTLKAFDTVKLPILDAYSGSDLHSQEQAKLRKNAARRKMNRNHQQIRLPQMVMYKQSHENRTTKKIRGWLDRNIAGFMVKER